MSATASTLVRRGNIPGWIVIFAVVAALLLCLGAGISLLAPERLVGPGAEINAAASVYAGYTFSRDLGLFLVLCVALATRSRQLMLAMMGMFSLINLADAVMDVKESRLPVFVVALLLSLIAGAATIRLWRLDESGHRS